MSQSPFNPFALYRFYPMGEALFVRHQGKFVDRNTLLEIIAGLEIAADMLLTATAEDYQSIYADCFVRDLIKESRVIWSPERYEHKYQPCVYFMQDGPKIKIGQTTDYNERIHKLRYEYGQHLKPLVAIETDRHKELEKIIHSRFIDLRISGDWFAPVDEILQWLDELRGM